MASKKRAAIEDCLRNWGISEFQTVLSHVNEKPEEFEPMIRSCYDQYLDLDEETLCWIMMVDAIVLIYYVGKYVDVVEKRKHKVDWIVEKMVPDWFKLENQVPLILIHSIHENIPRDCCKDLDENGLLLELCRMHSPLELTPDEESVNKTKGHLLHLMYQLIMKNYKSELKEEGKDEKTDHLQRERELTEKTMECVELAGQKGRELLQHLAEEFSSAVEKAESTGLKVPGIIQQVYQILGKFDKALQLQQRDIPTPGDKLEIPSVSRLYAILNVKFKPLPKECGIRNIQLKVPDRDRTDGYILFLPKIKFGTHTEVILKNLVAYESTILLQEQDDPTRLGDFVDLLYGLIRSEKDAKLLRNARIVEERGLSDAEIARLCRGIHKSDERPDDESKVHKTVNEANAKYNDLRFVKYWRIIMNFIANGWKGFRTVLPLLIFLFIGFQSVCEVYNCRSRSNNVSSVLLLGRNDLSNLVQYL